MDPKRPAFSIESKRGDHRNNLLSDKEFETSSIDFFNFAGELVINPTDDAGWMGDDTIGAAGAKIHLGRTFHDLVGQAVRPINREVYSLRIKITASVRIVADDLFAC